MRRNLVLGFLGYAVVLYTLWLLGGVTVRDRAHAAPPVTNPCQRYYDLAEKHLARNGLADGIFGQGWANLATACEIGRGK